MRVVLFLVFLWPATVFADCVVLLHGLARSETSLLLMQDVLRARGYDTVVPGYPSTQARVETLVAQTLPGAIETCGAQTVHFVTHSMGGILVRYWLQDHRPVAMGRVVMLGPPNQGSQLVDRLDDWAVFGLLNGPAGAQLGTGENSLPKALPAVDYPVGVVAGTQSLNAFFSALIDGPDDGKVGVSETRVDGMTAHLELPVTHTFMMNNPHVIAQSIRFLETGQFDVNLTWGGALTDLIEGEDKLR